MWWYIAFSAIFTIYAVDLVFLFVASLFAAITEYFVPALSTAATRAHKKQSKRVAAKQQQQQAAAKAQIAAGKDTSKQDLAIVVDTRAGQVSSMGIWRLWIAARSSTWQQVQWCNGMPARRCRHSDSKHRANAASHIIDDVVVDCRLPFGSAGVQHMPAGDMPAAATSAQECSVLAFRCSNSSCGHNCHSSSPVSKNSSPVSKYYVVQLIWP